MDFETALIKNNIEQAATCEHNEPATRLEFVIDSDQRVEWFSAKIKANKLRIEHQQKILADKLKQLEEIKEAFLHEAKEACAPYQNEINSLVARFGMQVLHYVNSTLPKRSRSRSIAGLTVGMRKKPDVILVDNEQLVIDWLTQNPEAIPENMPEAVALRVKKSALNEIYKAMKAADAEAVITGATFVTGTDLPYIKYGEEDLLDLYNEQPNDTDTGL